MSDNTSDTTSGTEAGVAEPSMEDILASIRRIIAEDDVTDQGHMDVGGPVSEADVNVVAPLSFDENLDDSILDLTEDLEIPEMAAESVVETEFNPVSNVVSDLEDKLASDKAELNVVESIDIVEEVEFVDVTEAVESVDVMEDLSDEFEDIDLLAPSKPVEDVIDTELNDVLDLGEFTDDESESVFDNLTEDLVFDDEPVDEVIEAIADPVENVFETPEPEATNVSSLTDINEFDLDAESDLDLVKSLMADLTDDSFLADDAEELASEPEDPVIGSVPEAEVELSVLDDLDASLELAEDDIDAAEQDQILSDILDMALEGEEDNNAIESDFDLTVDEDLAIPDPEESAEDLLLQIAAAAEADADVDEAAGILDVEEPDESADDILEELDMVLNEFSEDEAPIVEEHEVDTADMFVEPEAAPEPAEQENDEMAKTARNDSILNEIEETAAAGAFASLTKAVEDKAVVTESGPRIGELVQDALRPMLKEWLDENLKSIVERAVSKEVKRISSGK